MFSPQSGLSPILLERNFAQTSLDPRNNDKNSPDVSVVKLRSFKPFRIQARLQAQL